MRITSFFTAWLIYCAVGRGERIIYVNGTATGLDNGETWIDAYVDLQDALDDLAPGVDCPCEIWVAKGTYKPDRQSGLRTSSFQVNSGVSLLGGFAGNESTSSQRNWEDNETFLSGDIGVLEVEGDNSYHVLRFAEQSSAILVDGFTILNGLANGADGDEDGGAMLVGEGAEIRVANCKFTGNAASWGGAIYAERESAVDIENCRFDLNRAVANGGAIYFGPFGNHAITQSVFQGNWVGPNGFFSADGGAIMNNRTSLTVIGTSFRQNRGGLGAAVSESSAVSTYEGCLFSANEAESRGGAVFTQGGSPLFEDCLFQKNSAGSSGGAGHIQSQALFYNSTFEENSAEDGGALNLDGRVSIQDCTFTRNTATRGGAVMIAQLGDPNSTLTPAIRRSGFQGNLAMSGGAIYSAVNRPAIDSSLFVGNAALYGGSIFLWLDECRITSCTFSQSSAITGSVLYNFGNEGSTRNSILWDDHSATVEPIYIHPNYSPAYIVEHSIVRGGWPGPGALDENPLFRESPDPGFDGQWGTDDDLYGDHHVSFESPAVNAGNANYAGASDKDGGPRILCGGLDLGAYELGAGDSDCDADVDLVDVEGFESCATEPQLGGFIFPECKPFDMNVDGDVDLHDFARMQQLFLFEP